MANARLLGLTVEHPVHTPERTSQEARLAYQVTTMLRSRTKAFCCLHTQCRQHSVMVHRGCLRFQNSSPIIDFGDGPGQDRGKLQLRVCILHFLRALLRALKQLCPSCRQDSMPRILLSSHGVERAHTASLKPFKSEPRAPHNCDVSKVGSRNRKPAGTLKIPRVLLQKGLS